MAAEFMGTHLNKHPDYYITSKFGNGVFGCFHSSLDNLKNGLYLYMGVSIKGMS